jgi:hypothetical protein
MIAPLEHIPLQLVEAIVRHAPLAAIVQAPVPHPLHALLEPIAM